MVTAPFEDKLPQIFTQVQFADVRLWQWIGIALALVFACVIGVFVAGALLWVALRLARRTRAKWDDDLVKTLRGPMRMFVALVLLRIFVEPLHLAALAQELVGKLVQIAAIGAVAWSVLRIVAFGAEL